MKSPTPRVLVAAFLSVALHALVWMWVTDGVGQPETTREAKATPPEAEVVFLEATATPPGKPLPPQPPVAKAVPPPPTRQAAPLTDAPPRLADAANPTERTPAFREAPPAPTSEEWALAATYSLKNSKRYRHTWGQQVRSMMGQQFSF